MSNIEKIRQEIERRKKENMYDNLPITIGRYYEDRDLLAFIDSLPDEQFAWQDIKKIVNIADGLLDDPKVRMAIQNHYYEDRDLLAFIDSLPDEQFAWQDIKKIVNIADGLLDDPRVRMAIQNHSEEEYYQKVLDEYNKDVLKE